MRKPLRSRRGRAASIRGGSLLLGVGARCRYRVSIRGVESCTAGADRTMGRRPASTATLDPTQGGSGAPSSVVTAARAWQRTRRFALPAHRARSVHATDTRHVIEHAGVCRNTMSDRYAVQRRWENGDTHTVGLPPVDLHACERRGRPSRRHGDVTDGARPWMGHGFGKADGARETRGP